MWLDAEARGLVVQSSGLEVHGADETGCRSGGFRRVTAGGYTSSMDRVRFGRALGFGARQAMKTVAAAVDAATAEAPSARRASAAANTGQGAASGPRPAGSASAVPEAAANKAASAAAKKVAQAREVKKGLKRGSRRFGEAVWGPFVRLSGVLWLEVSGVFFGIFALMAVGYLWKMRGVWHSSAANVEGHRGVMGAVAMLVLFGYFCVSNFVRARQRERQR